MVLTGWVRLQLRSIETYFQFFTNTKLARILQFVQNHWKFSFKPRLHWSSIMLSAARLSSFKRGFDSHWGGCKRKRRFDALGTAVCHVVLHTMVHCCLVHALQLHWGM